MELRAGRRRQKGARGAFCWGDETGACCVDGGSTYPADQLYVYLEEVPELHFADLGSIVDLSYEIWSSRIVVVDEGRAWTDEIPSQPIRRQAVPRATSPVRLPGDLPHGLYLIHVFAEPAAGGDTSQGFRIYVGPAPAGATPTAEATWPPPPQP